MVSRWTGVVLMFVPACGEDGPVVPPCGEDGLQSLESPMTPEETRYNTVLEHLRAELHIAVGQYLDGSLPAYTGKLTTLERRVSSDYGESQAQVSGPAYGVLDDDRVFIDFPGNGEAQVIRRLLIYFPADDYRTEFAEDIRAPGVPIEGVGSSWTTCEGAVTSLFGSPDRITLSDIVCVRHDPGSTVRFEFSGVLERLDPGRIEYAELSNLREAGVVGHLPSLGMEDPATGVRLTTEPSGKLIYNRKDACHDEVEYRSVSFVRPECLASHGVSELELGDARHCCCLGCRVELSA